MKQSIKNVDPVMEANIETFAEQAKKKRPTSRIIKEKKQLTDEARILVLRDAVTFLAGELKQTYKIIGALTKQRNSLLN